MLTNLPNLKAPFRDMSIEDIMSCMFGLRKFETETYFTVVNKGTITVNDLVDDFNKDRSTIQRALQNLAIAGLIWRVLLHIPGGPVRRSQGNHKSKCQKMGRFDDCLD